tara:strand:- start:430925 stop:431368 length:444 start_codon:yes stop_codon:yes gene_type:complete
MAYFRLVAVVLGFSLIALFMHQVWSVLEGDFDSVIMPGPVNVAIVVLAFVAGIIALRFGFSRIVVSALVFFVAKWMGAVIAILAAFEVVGALYPMPFEGPLTYIGFSDMTQSFGLPVGSEWLAFIMLALGFLLFYSSSSLLEEGSLD